MVYLFIYGTLLSSQNPFGDFLSQNSKLICQGRFKGMLYNVGEYPGAVYYPKSHSYVYGSVISLSSPDETLKIVDDYEGYGIEQPQPNEFIREVLDIETVSGSIRCWVYLFNLPTEGLTLIRSGNYIKFLENSP